MYPSVSIANNALVAAQAKKLGHEYKVVCTWMIEDDADIYAECSCGWKSRVMRDSSSCSRMGKAHLADVVRKPHV